MKPQCDNTKTNLHFFFFYMECLKEIKISSSASSILLQNYHFWMNFMNLHFLQYNVPRGLSFRASTAKTAIIAKMKISLKAMVTLFPKKHGEILRCAIRYLNISVPCMST